MSATTTRKPLTTHSFTLVFADKFEELPRELLDALFEAGCDDSHVSLRDGALRIAFDREAPSFRVALLSAIADVDRSGFWTGVRVGVEPE